MRSPPAQGRGRTRSADPTSRSARCGSTLLCSRSRRPDLFPSSVQISRVEIVGKGSALPPPAKFVKKVKTQILPNASIFFHRGQRSGSLGSEEGCGTSTMSRLPRCWRWGRADERSALFQSLFCVARDYEEGGLGRGRLGGCTVDELDGAIREVDGVEGFEGHFGGR